MCMKFKQIGTLLLAIAGIAFSLNACQSDIDYELHRVRFQARSAGGRTKTVYGDIVEGFKVIAWEAGDKIRIYCPDSAPVTGSDTPALSGYIQSDYNLTGITAEGRISKAGLSPVGGQGLMWNDGSGKADFYAVYPYTNAVAVSGGKIAAKVEIPAVQDGGDDVSTLSLVAAAKNVAEGDAVSLEFNPAFTTFQFTLKSGPGSGELALNSVTLSTTSSSAYVAGAGYYPIDGGTFEYTGTPSKDVTINFNPAAVISEADASATTFTFFALPVDLTNMTLTVNWTKEGTIKEKSLRLNSNGSPIPFSAGDFINITGVAVPDLGIRLFVSGVEVHDLDHISHTVSF